ncbi:MAG: hypothetical protein QM709_10955 [Spongiibacteraceae bacterium]
MTYRSYLFTTLTILALASSMSVYAQEMDVDQADSLRFNDFHTDKKAAVKVWEKKPETTKAYTDTTASTPTTPAPTTTTTVAGSNNASATTASVTGDLNGKRFELRERYTLTRSTKTPYSAFYVLEPLYKQAAQLCTKGWKKLSERSEPIEQDYYLYLEIECL